MRTIGRRLPTVSRVLLGLVFLVNGLNGFVQFLPRPPMPPAAAAFAQALVDSGYLFPLLKAIEVAAGAMLVAGVLVPLALTVLAPVIVNIAAFHLFLAPAGMPVVAVLLATELHLAWAYRSAFAPLFARRARSSAAASPIPAARTAQAA